MTLKQVRPERTGWRDEEISRRHREWGYDCPAVDLDFVLIEFDRCKACALVDYKHQECKTPPTSASLAAMSDLASRAKIPAFACWYADDFSWFWPVPLNQHAEQWAPKPYGKKLSERQWVEMLYVMRGRPAPEELTFHD
jgi:hypothetical protein